MGKIGKIDLDGDRLLALLVASVKMNQRRACESERGGDWGGVESALTARSSVLSVLQLAIRERNAKETEAARSIVDQGEARMAMFTRDPEWWDVLDRCCISPYRDHIIYRTGDEMGDEEGILLCPFGRGYWQPARELLRDLPIHLRAIAQRSARRIAPRWQHWATRPRPDKNFARAMQGRD